MDIKTIEITDFNSLPEEALKSEEPVVLRGLVADWPICQLDTAQEQINYFTQYGSDSDVIAWMAPATEKGRFLYDIASGHLNFQHRRVGFQEFLSFLQRHQGKQNSPTVYMGSTPVELVMPDFLSAHPLPQLDSAPLKRVWIGNQTVVAPHFDTTDNVACVLAGRRRFTLFPPAQWENLYIGPLDKTPAGQPISSVDINNPDYDKYPRYKKAEKHKQVVDLLPGDAIFIPSPWWHHVQGLDDFNVLLNYWWREAPEAAGNPMDALLQAILSIKSLPQNQRQSWQSIFEQVVFQPSDTSHIPEKELGWLGELDENTASQIRNVLKQGL